MRISCYGEEVLPSTGELQPPGNSRAGRLTVTAGGARELRGMSWLGALIVAAMAALVLLLQCAALPHHNTAATALPHHAVAAGSTLQRGDIAATAHNHIGQAEAFVCSVADSVAAQLAAPTVLRVLWIGALALLAYAAVAAGSPAWTRGPPHTGAVAIATGRIILHRFCVLRR